ncbi:MAG: helix-turn-helix domain-containing protein [Clostridia bacterium]|nr:helix-turn-helix domain-containing protein [Clostridia bacterium]
MDGAKVNVYESFIKYVKEKSGIDVKIYGEGVHYAEPDVELSPENLKSAVNANGKFFFTLLLNDKTVVAAISEKDGNEKTANLINALAENFSLKTGYVKSEFLTALLHGELNFAQIKRYSEKFKIPDAPVSVIIISVSGGDALSAEDVIANYGDNASDEVIELGGGEFAVIKFSDEKNDEYRSQSEYAEYLLQTVYEETGVRASAFVGGKVKRLSELSESYIQARAAQSFAKQVGVHSYREYVLLGMIQDLPKHKIKEYFDLLEGEGAKEIFSDAEMLSTAEEFFNNNLNASETSRSMFLHRNTLSYRLDKIEKATGLNIRKFSDAVTFRLITYLNELLK